MDVSVVLKVLVVWFVVAHTKNCTIHTDCKSCTEDWPCKWCSTTANCGYFSDIFTTCWDDKISASWLCPLQPLQPGVIAGIVVGVLVGVGCICTLCVCFVKVLKNTGKVVTEELNVPLVWPQEPEVAAPIPQDYTPAPVNNPYEGYAEVAAPIPQDYTPAPVNNPYEGYAEVAAPIPQDNTPATVNNPYEGYAQYDTDGGYQ
eukprot:TRINITY_DN3706_c0_g1_i1.p1 TRINITY_DN3706_c0_g1~~TRINITY_DN3706_c0_g1_i1.p1  ORF type:complete len:214 (-),score=27.69 TRINITY_DN3706_c0_g1_i1:43-648(-)